MISLIFLTACETVKYVYIYPDFMHPTEEHEPKRSQFLDGGFSSSEEDLVISERDAKIFAEYITALRTWGKNGWTWVRYYKEELLKLKENLPIEK